MRGQKEFLERIDVDYAYRLAKRMEEHKCNPVLGYRSAGSRAEFLTGEMLEQEMRRIGFSNVRKDKIPVDAWEFKKARLSYEDRNGREKTVELGGYQTTFVTRGKQEFSLCYVNRGTGKDYEGLDVKGKLVLADINQRDEWWINYPVFQAHKKGAAALIAAQSGGYGEIDEEALNSQDIAGPEDAPAFSISRKDARELKGLLREKGELRVFLEADSRVEKNKETYNIVGEIPGRREDRRILLSAHYDSYFDGFQDDNTAIAMMLNIGKTLLEIGYQPENTLTFCAMAAEEWGVSDSKFDWSTGAYEEIFRVHPQWRGKVLADLNFELPALAHGDRDRIRSTYEYVDFLERFLEELPELTSAFPEGIGVAAPIETWSDDFSMAIGGIPSMVNDFSAGSFMETHYHSQFDNDTYYDEKVYRFHHELYGLLLMKFDSLALPPLDFANMLRKLRQTVELGWGRKGNVPLPQLMNALSRAGDCARVCYESVKKRNQAYEQAREAGDLSLARRLCQSAKEAEALLMETFQREQNAFVRLGWEDEVLYPTEILQNNLAYLEEALEALEEGKGKEALEAVYYIDNNAYAFLFDEEVYLHFTMYRWNQPREKLKWGYKRVMHHTNLYSLVQTLQEKIAEGETDFQKEIGFLQEVLEQQYRYYREECLRMTEAVERMERDLGICRELLEG